LSKGREIRPYAGLTDMQSLFVRYVCDGMNHTKAAELAGYAGDSSTPSRVASHPEVIKAIGAELVRRLASEGAPVGYSVLLSIARNEAASDRARIDASKALLDRAGYVPPRASEPAPASFSVDSMDREQLRRFIAEAESKLASEAKDVTP
jgi:phage terminase small subunit